MTLPEPVVPWSADLTLDETVGRLGGTGRVRAVSLLGSTGTSAWTDASDIDLCLVLDGYPPAVGVETTVVDGRIADVVLIDRDAAAAMLAPSLPEREAAAAVAPGQWPYVHWLADARPVHDPDGVAGAARDRAARLVAHEVPSGATSQREVRRWLSHDVRVAAALLPRTADPVLAASLGLRQLHTFVSAVQAWTTLRGRRSRGWKCDFAHLAVADPPMFAMVQEWLAASGPVRRHEVFVRVVEHVLAPVGGLVPTGTVLERDADVWPDLGRAGPAPTARP
ncbi:hypothetical protein [Phycicoccus avicenniae]|uniref:hypothetical protein n=1 Tax=Phycicoccus avicenniae TaxID=2828860 RepID=UPI003D287487